jgi:hypothetical protein
MPAQAQGARSGWMRIGGVIALGVGAMLGDGAALAAQDPSTLAMQAFQARRAELHARLHMRMGLPKNLTDNVLFSSVFFSGFEAVDPDCLLDSDGDGLPDCVETNTGVFVDITDTGTDPFNPDTDGDGISDGDEVLGTIDGLDLPAMGVSPLRRDLLIEYDWFDDRLECGAHSHRPDAHVLARVAAAFAAAPLVNPDGSTGINVIQDVGQGGVFDGGNRIEGFDPVLPGALDATYRQIKQANFADNRRGYFRYVLMPHRYNGGSSSSGYAEIIGDDAIVSLYCAHSEDNVARTILHEIGHNLGLHHGGFEACNGKPNYNSIMNYRYQFTGLDDSCDGSGDRGSDGFSTGQRLPLDEADIDELQGVCGNPPIDWNRNGALETGIAQNLRPGFEAECGSALRRLEDFDDFAQLTFLGLHVERAKLHGLQDEVGCAGAPP